MPSRNSAQALVFGAIAAILVACGGGSVPDAPTETRFDNRFDVTAQPNLEILDDIEDAKRAAE